MHSANKKSKFLRTASKGLCFVVLLVLIFSPLGQAFSTPTAQAAPVCIKTSAAKGGHWDTAVGVPDSSGNCADPAAHIGDGTPPSTDIECGLLSHWDICISNVVYVFTVGLGSGVAYIGSYFFSFAVKLSLQGPIYALDFISQGWATVRDLANMSFIFILIYLAFMIMLRAETAHTLQILAGVIVVALLVNFSFFMTRVVIDVGNIAAVQFYNAIESGSISQTNAAQGAFSSTAATPRVAGILQTAGSYVGVTTGDANATTKDLTWSIMGALDVQNILGGESFKQWNGGNNGFFSPERLIVLSFIYICVGMIMFVLAAMFFTAGVKFIMRIVALWFAIIASPLALVARTLHQTEKYYEYWQSMLIKNAAYPAVFLFIFLIITKFANTLAGDHNSIVESVFSDITSSNSNAGYFIILAGAIANVGIRLGFIVAIMYLGLRASESIGAWGASAAKAVTSRGLNIPGFLTRNSFGLAGQRFTETKFAKDLSERAGIGGLVGRTLMAGAGLAGRSSFDYRAAPGLRGASGLKDIMGEANKGGFAGVDKEKARIKAIKDRAEGLKGNELDEQKAQEAFIREYDNKNGGNGQYEKNVAVLATRLSKARKDSETASRAALRSEGDLKKGFLEQAASAKKIAKIVEQDLNYLRNQGKKIVEEQGNARIDLMVKRLTTRNWQNMYLPSRATLKGAAQAAKLTVKKDGRALAADAVKVLHDEENDGGEDGGAAPAAPAGGGGGNQGNGPGGNPHGPHTTTINH
jgi:hypothetical protein